MTEPPPEGEWRRFVLEKQLRESGLPPATRAVWHVIAGYAKAKTGDVDPRYSPSYQTIATAAGLKSRRTAIDHVNTLVKSGWMLRAPGTRRTDPPRYRLSSPVDPSPPIDRLVTTQSLAESGLSSDSPATSDPRVTRLVTPQSLASDSPVTSTSDSPVTHSRVLSREIQGVPPPPSTAGGGVRSQKPWCGDPSCNPVTRKRQGRTGTLSVCRACLALAGASPTTRRAS